MENKLHNRMEPAFHNRLIEGRDNIYAYSRRNGKLKLVANQKIKQLDEESREKFYQHLCLEYGFSQEEIDKVKQEIKNS
ncbi:hypothetical protein [Halobacillus sp. H74]|uniref:hypothetical protein n=1 Tax=Halobacillus sp. H74 TaxID=3457436 RepID=UPI003FCC6BA4